MISHFQSVKIKKRGVEIKHKGARKMSRKIKAGNKGNNNQAKGGKPFAKAMVLALISAISIIALAPALFAEQAMMAKDIGSMCGARSLVSDSNLGSIGSYGTFTAPELVDYDADGNYELVVGYDDGDIRTFQYNSTATPKWQPDKLAVSGSTAGTRRTVSAVDFDKDGDFDLIASEWDGGIHYYENVGTRQQPNWTLNRGIAYPDMRYKDTAPFADAVDFDKDGYYDLLVGTNQFQGRIELYENMAGMYGWEFKPFSEQFADDIGSYTQCAFVDLDNEGVLDMVCSRNSQTIYKFNNAGNLTEPEWEGYETVLSTGLGSQTYFSIGDLDNDTDYDIMVGEIGGNVYYFENTGTKDQPLFTSGVDIFGYSLGTNTTPAFVDIDDDGDLDIYIGEDTSNEVKFYNNTGNATDYSFTLVSAMKISVGANRPVPHAVDIDNDGDYDLLVGISNGQVRLYNNTGTAQMPSFSSYATVVDIGDYAAPGFGDIDNDGDLDMAAGNQKGLCMFYYNSGNSTNILINTSLPGFHPVLLPENEIVDIKMHDFDSDGDFDIIMGRYGENNDDYYDASILYYENIGSSSKPLLSETAKWEDYSTSRYDTHMALGDMDNDGDLDMIANNNVDPDFIYYYENMGDELSYNWSGWTTDYFGFDFGSDSIPYAVDFDNDNDFDIIVGEYQGNVRLMRNDGNSTVPSFTNAGFVQTTGLVDLDIGTRSCPAAADMDNDGDIDLIIGDRETDYIEYWQNNGTGYFSVVSANMLSGKVGGKDYPCPRLSDLDGDGDYDMVVGVAEYIYMILNTGTPESPSWGSHNVMIDDSTGSKYDVIDYYPVPSLYDLNNDSVIDIIVGDDSSGTYPIGEILQFRHYSSNTSTEFSKFFGYFNGSHKFWTPSFNQDTHNYIAPALADMNNDGNPDLFMGYDDGYVDFAWNYGRITGNKSVARNMVWSLKSKNMLGGYIADNTYLGPMSLELYDIDNDNDLDVFAYARDTADTSRGWLYLIENVGNPASYLFLPANAEEIWKSETNKYVCGGTYHDMYPLDMEVKDFDNDGDGDIKASVGFYASQVRRYGKPKLFINNGTLIEPSFNELIAGNTRTDCTTDSFLPYHGWWPASYLYDADGDLDMDAFLCTTRGYCLLLENKGVYTDPRDIAENTRFIKHSVIENVLGGSSYSSKPRAVDFDGDGDYDIIIGTDDSSDNKLKYYENKGTGEELRFVNTQNYSLNSDHDHPVPAIADTDHDGDNDIVYGYDTGGYIGAYRNDGTYEENTCVTLVNSSLYGEPGVSVEFRNSSGIICSGSTDSNGRAQCNISYSDNEVYVVISGSSDPHRVLVSAYADSGRSSTNAEFQAAGTSSKIALERMLFNVFSPGDYTATETRIDISDSDLTMFSGITNSSGALNAWLPKKYIMFRNEPYTQNRITYNIEVFANDDYDRALEIEDVYAPNKINLSSQTESSKLFKFPATETMATGSRYKVHVIYPAYTAQRSYNITDTVNSNLTIVSNVTVSYMGESCTIVPASHSYSVDYTDTGCDFLADIVEGNGEWVKVEYIIETPSLATFESEGWSTQDFVSDPATIKLVS